MVLPAQAGAGPGDLVPEFGEGGVVHTPVSGGQNQTTSDLMVADDETLLVAGRDTGTGRSLLRRYLPDGGLDGTFGENGTVSTEGTGWDSVASAGDGKLIVAGSAGSLFKITRLNADGSIDDTFGIDGSFTLDAGPLKSPGYSENPVEIDLFALKVLDDGRIRAIGSYFGCEYGCANLVEIGLLEDGSTDPSFGDGGGVVALPQDGLKSWVLIEGDGKAQVIRGYPTEGENGPALDMTATTVDVSGLPEMADSIRFWVSDVYGARDSGSRAIVFDARGNLLIGVGNRVISVTDGGRTVAPGVAPRTRRWDLTRFLPWSNPQYEINDLGTDPEGRLLVSGGIARGFADGSNQSGFVARFLANGRPDATFSNDGMAIAWLGQTKVGYDRPPSNTSLIQTADSIVIAGNGNRDGKNGFNLAKVEAGSIEWLRCNGRLADYIGDGGPDVIRKDSGTFVTLGGADRILESGGTVCSGDGNDTITSPYASLDVFAGAGNDRLIGSRSKDVLRGGPGRDTIRGFGQDDRLFGGTDNDLLEGGSWNDRIFGGPGKDVLRGGSGRDQLIGGPGRDRLNNGSKGPRILIYRGTLSGVTTKFIRIGKRPVRARVFMDLKCFGDDVNSLNLSSSGIKVNPRTGRFKRIGPPYDPTDDLNFVADFEGHFAGGFATGRLGIIDSDHFSDNYTCWSGKSLENPWVRFRAKLQPIPRQFARQ